MSPAPFRCRHPHVIGAAAVLLVGLGALAPRAGAVDVLTDHYNNSRSGTNLAETTLTQANVAVGTFGKLYTRVIDGYTYCQPLYVSGVTIAGASHNVVYAAPGHNSVYAFDADDGNGSIPAYWSVNLGPSVPYLDVYPNRDTNIIPEVGITGTPVIDKATGTLYVVSFSKEAGPSYHQRLHALDLATGAEKFGGPTEISDSRTVGGHVLTFNPARQNQRPGLVLANGSVYIAWASFGDIGLNDPPEWSYKGYVMRYSASTLQQQAVFVAAPGGGGAGIWQVGCGPAVDAAGNLYVVTGNGTSDTDAGGINYGESALRLTPNLTVADWFTPYDKDYLNAGDGDLGAAGQTLLEAPNAPVHKHLMIHGSKSGKIYVLDRDNMGHFHAGDDSNIAQQVWATADIVKSVPVYWQGPAGGHLFINHGGGYGARCLYSFAVDANGVLTYQPEMTATLLDGAVFKGSHMIVSSNGAAAGSGVLWTFSPSSGEPISATVPGKLRAFNAETLQEIYNSELNPTRDSIGNYPKYVPATVVNGKVYVPTFSGQLHVFGQVPLNPSLTIALTSPLANASYAEPANIPIAVSTTAGAATITKVRYYNGSNQIAEVTAAPFGLSWNNITAGTYALRAIAIDSNGATATSGTVTVSVVGSGGTGTILRQVWSGIPGTAVVQLTSAPGFPDSPTTQEQLTSFDAPINVADNYGARIVGYVYPPISGSYTFWIAGDDNCELWLSSDDNPANMTRIASVPDYTGPQEWNKFSNQQSAPRVLIGGQRYYIEAREKEGTGGDNLAVGWQLPNGVFERPIQGSHLSPFVPAGAAPYGMPGRGNLAGLPLPSDLGTPPPATLSATGVFADLAALTPSSGIVPYTPNTALWSDAAVKSRWIALPNSSRIGFATTGEWTFPAGTVFIKHFELGIDDANQNARKRLETRLLVLDNTGANGYGITYKWRADGSDADLVPASGQDEDVTIANAGGGTRVQTWHYPSQGECLICHTVNAGFVLGPKTRQLNGTITYPSSGVADNQLRTWNHLGMFTTDIGEANIAGMSRMKALSDGSAALEDRVKSYLDANCAQCHRAGGIAGWDARYDLAMASQGIIGATPAHGDLGVAGARIVMPADPTHSVLRLRMASTTTGIKMPPLARNLVDTAALAVIDQWINGLTAVGTGSGLTAQYWTNQDRTFSGTPTLTRIDPRVDFDWGVGSPDPSISVDHFTARWSGQVQALASETYTFAVTGDDGVRLWVNGQLLVDQWIDQGATTWSGNISLTAGQKYDLRLEYYENGGGTTARLAWSSPSLPLQIIPSSQLYPAAFNAAPTVSAGADLAITLPASASLGGSASDDGVPAALSVAWSVVSGPGAVTFTNATAVATSASFAASGTYTLRLTASDGALATSDDVVVTVAAGSGTPILANGGFETPPVGSGTWGSFAYAPANAGWTFTGYAGVSGNASGFTGGNPAAPEGAQVGVLQITSSISQSVAMPAGSYTVTFQAAQRGNWQHGGQDFQVLVDGGPVGTFTPTGTSYAGYATAVFSVPAGNHQLTFQGLDTVGGDNTVFLDDVRIVVAIPSVATVANGGFETPSVGSNTWGAFANPPNAGWTGVCISGNGSGYTSGNPAAPEGVQVGVLQMQNSFSQSVAMPGGSYTVTFLAAQRGNWQHGGEDFQVLIDNGVVGTFTPAGTTYASYATAVFTVPAGNHELRFHGLNSLGDDNTAFIDDVRLHLVPADSGFNATYYDNVDLTGTAISRIDPVIDFEWGVGSPDPAMGVETFSARWTARVVPQASETYTFYTTTDDGARLWVNGQLVIDKWIDQGPTTWTGAVALTAGQAANVRMEFYENGGWAMAKLEWSSASTPRQVVPVGAAAPSGLFAVNVNFQPAGAPVPGGYLADTGAVFGDRGNGYTYGWNMTTTGAAYDRDNPLSPDQRYDTLNHLQQSPNPNGVWEIAVPNGSYQVRVVSGDADHIDSVYKLAVEGLLLVDGTPAAAPFSAHWVDSGYQTVAVSDGRLTVANAPGAANNKICFIEIFQQPVALGLNEPRATPPGEAEIVITGALAAARRAPR